MALSSLTVDLTLGLAKFQSDAGKAASIANQLGRDIGNGILIGGQAISAASAIVGAGALALLKYTDGAAKAAAEFHGLAERTGASASAIASFQTASDTSGVSLNKVTGLMERLQVTLSRPLDPDRGPGAALKAIGLNADELRAKKPDEQLEAIAKALATYAEGGGRTAAVITLLGKSAAGAIPFLNDLAESGRTQIRLTDEQIELADRYAKAQARSSSELRQLAQAAALQALPAMNAFMETLRDTGREIVGVDAASNTLGKSTAVADFAETAVRALGFVVDAGDGVIRTFGAVGKFVGGYAAVAGALMRGEVDQAKAIGAEFRADADALLSAPLFSERLAARLAASKAPAAPEAAKPQLNFRIPEKATAATSTKGIAESTKAYDSLVRSIVEKTSAAEAELVGGERLAESQRVALEVVTKLAATEGKFSEQQKISAGALLSTYVATQQAVEARVQQIAAAENLRRAEADSAAALDRTADARLNENQALRDALVEYGLTADQLDRLRVKRLEDALASEQQALAVGRARDLSEAEAAGIERNIRLLQEQINLRSAIAAKVNDEATNGYTGATRALNDYARAALESGTATRQAVGGVMNALENDLTQSLATGKVSVRGFVDLAVSELIRLTLVRPLIVELTEVLADLGKQARVTSLLTSAVGAGSGGGGSWLDWIGLIAGVFGGSSAGAGMSDVGGINAGYPAYGLAVGTNRIPYDGFRAILHKDEAVVPAAYNPAANGAMVRPMTTGASGSGWGGGGNVSVIVENNNGGTVTTEEQQNGQDKLIKIIIDKAVAEVDKRIAKGGSTSEALKAKGVRMSGGNPRRD